MASGDEAGFVLEPNGDVWRVSDTIELVAQIPPYESPVGGTANGVTYFAGVRCADAGCSEVVSELTVVNGAEPTAIELATEPGDLETSGGLASVPADDGSTWFHTADLLVEADAATGDIVQEATGIAGDPCVIDGRLLAVVDATASSNTGVVTEESAATPAFELQEWGGTGWVPLPGQAVDGPPLSSGYCTPGAFEVRESSGSVIHRWTPGTGWSEAADASDASVGVSSPVMTSTGNQYTIESSGRLLRITGLESSVDTSIQLPPETHAQMPPALAVDDSGDLVFACFVESSSPDSGATSCMLAQQ